MKTAKMIANLKFFTKSALHIVSGDATGEDHQSHTDSLPVRVCPLCSYYLNDGKMKERDLGYCPLNTSVPPS